MNIGYNVEFFNFLTCFDFHCRPEANPPIPPDAKLTYEIQLLAVRDGPNISTMSDEERMTIGYATNSGRNARLTLLI